MCKFAIPVFIMPLWWILINAVIYLSVLSIFVAVLIDFNQFHKKKAKKEKRSIVETGTMIGFFICFYFLIRLRIGSLPFDARHATVLEQSVIFLGLIMIVAGTLINIWGRKALGKQWSNQIKIYSDHNLVRNGPYKMIRHPLYSSLILMFWGASLVYVNPWAFLANTFIFLPFMYYRAKQEEDLLGSSIDGYKNYQKETGMFCPKFWRKK